MKPSLPRKRNQAITLVEVLIIVAVIGVLAALVFPAWARSRARSFRVCCINNLKQTGLAFQVWAGDHHNKYPMEVSEKDGGSMEFTAGPNVFRHFQTMSNELSTPGILTCGSEVIDFMSPATNFSYLRNSNISFFVGVDASETNEAAILAGDHNVTNGTVLKNGLLELTTNRLTGWTKAMHNKVGNVLLADGSVQQVNISGVRDLVANTGLSTNRLQMP
jgi:prepilin-type processing-associated H-X9-DG protein